MLTEWVELTKVNVVISADEAVLSASKGASVKTD